MPINDKTLIKQEERLPKSILDKAIKSTNEFGWRQEDFLEVIEAARKVTGKPIETIVTARRAGDPSRLVANSGKARTLLGWNPQFTDLETIIESAWKWHQRHPKGYDEA